MLHMGETFSQMLLRLIDERGRTDSAAYTLSESSRFDVIISFFLEKEIYNIFEINETLFYYDQPVLSG